MNHGEIPKKNQKRFRTGFLVIPEKKNPGRKPGGFFPCRFDALRDILKRQSKRNTKKKTLENIF